jgi:hypothetical protein
VGSRGGAGQVVASGDVPRRRRDDGAEEVAQDSSVPAGEAAPVVGGGLGVLRPETKARGRLLVRRSGGRRNGCGGRKIGWRGGGLEGWMPHGAGAAWGLAPTDGRRPDRVPAAARAGSAPLFW